MRIYHFIKLSLLIVLILTIWAFFIPRSYDVQAFEERAGTEYWLLNTGSKIGLTIIKSKAEDHKSPIIYLHGGPGGLIHDEIIQVLKPLADTGHDLYFYDQVGSGHSSRLEDIQEYSVDRHRADLQEIIEKINSEKVIIIAHSWGCLLAINYIQENPDKVEKTILTGPGPILPINKNMVNEIAPDSLNLIAPEFSNSEGNRKANNLRSRLVSKWAYIFNRKLASDKEMDDFFTHLNEELSKSTFCKTNQTKKFKGGGGYYSHIMTVKSFDAVQDKRKSLKNMTIPVLILRGQCDNQKWGFAKEYLDLLPNSQIVIIENVGHDVVKGNRDEYFNLVSGFIK